MPINVKLLLTCTAAWAFVASSQAATTVNVKFTGSGAAQSTITAPGYGLWGQGTETWNRMNSYNGTDLADSSGVATDIDYSFTATRITGPFAVGKLDNNYGDDAIQQGGIFGARDPGEISTLILGGLTPGKQYEIIVFMADGAFAWSSTAFEGIAPSDYTDSLASTGTDLYVDAFDGGTDFWFWTGVAPTAGGQATLSIDDGNWDVITAFQIREVPEPSTIVLGIGVLTLAVVRRRRA